MAPNPPRPVKSVPPAERFRDQIEAAVEAGTDLSTLVLKLTLGDASKLKRDRTIPVSDVSFVDGHMHYLGVRVIQGDTAASALVPLDKA